MVFTTNGTVTYNNATTTTAVTTWWWPGDQPPGLAPVPARPPGPQPVLPPAAACLAMEVA